MQSNHTCQTAAAAVKFGLGSALALRRQGAAAGAGESAAGPAAGCGGGLTRELAAGRGDEPGGREDAGGGSSPLRRPVR